MTRFEPGDCNPRRLGSVPAVGLEPSVTYPPFSVVRNPPPSRQARHLSVAEQRRFTDWANQQAADVATVADLAVIAAAEAAAEEAVVPPSPAIRVNWGRVAAWSPVLLLAGYTVARFASEHRQLAFWTVAIGAAYGVTHWVDRVRA